MNNAHHRTLLLTALLAFAPCALADVTATNAWSATYPVDSAAPTLLVSNIWGSVRVSPGPPGEITANVQEHRSAPTQALFDRSIEFFELDVAADESGVAMIVGGEYRDWQDLSRCRGCRVDYQLELLVPVDTTVDVSTVIDGRVTVTKVEGPVSASNVNGPIAIDELKDCGEVESVNGSVALSFARAPTSDCRLETVNGDITLTLPQSAGMDVSLALFNGRVVSEFEVDPLAIPATVDEFDEDGRYRYRISQASGVRLGGGGPLFSFTSMNGDILIKSNQ